MVHVLTSQFNKDKELNFHFTYLLIQLYCSHLYCDSVRSGFKQNTGWNEIIRR